MICSRLRSAGCGPRRSRRLRPSRFCALPILAVFLVGLFSQGSPYEVGWAWIETDSQEPLAATALYGGFDATGALIWEAAIEATQPMRRGRVYVERTATTRTAVALVNPGEDALTVTAVLRDREGTEVGRRGLTIEAGKQAARFIDEWFPAELVPGDDFIGSLTMLAEDPDSEFAAVTLRENLNGRGEPIYATLPVASMDVQSDGGSNVDVLAFPQIAGGAGLITQLVLVNPFEVAIQGRIDFFRAGGSPLLLYLGDEPVSGVDFLLAGNGVFRAELSSPQEIRSGYGVLHVESGSPLPRGTAIYRRQVGSALSEAGVNGMRPTHHVRLLVNEVGSGTGVAVAPLGDPLALVHFELTGMDGTPVDSLDRAIGPEQTAYHSVELFSGMPPGFIGLLDISSNQPFAAASLKTTTNSRGEYLVTTLPVADLTNPPAGARWIIPQIGFGSDLSTRLIILPASGAPATAQGVVHFVRFDGSPMPVPVYGTPQSALPFEIDPRGVWRFDPATEVRAADILLEREIVLQIGQTLQLNPVVVDDRGIGHSSIRLDYRILGLDIASVDRSGWISGLREGAATLIVASGDLVRTATVTVVAATPVLVGAAVDHLAIDASGRFLLAGSQDQVIRRSADPSTRADLYAGVPLVSGYRDGPRLDALFNDPSFLAFDTDSQTLYVSDRGNHRIRMVTPDPDGEVRTLELNGPPLERPEGLAFDVEGNLWVADSDLHTVGRIDLQAGTYEVVAGQPGEAGFRDGPAGESLFQSPHGLAFEGQSVLEQLAGERLGDPPPVSILVADTGNGVVRRIIRDGSGSEIRWQVETVGVGATSHRGRRFPLASQQTGSLMEAPTGVSLDPFGDIAVTDRSMGEFLLILPSGDLISALPGESHAVDVLATKDGSFLVTEGPHGVARVVFGNPTIVDIVRAPAGPGEESVTVIGSNFTPETAVLVERGEVIRPHLIDSHALSFVMPSTALRGGFELWVQNRGGLDVASLPARPCQGVVTLADPNLEAAVREALDLDASQPLTCQWVASLSWLEATSRDIQSLEGLQNFTGLRGLFLGGNRISDLSPLSALFQIDRLSVYDNQLADLAPLSGLSDLTSLHLERNHVSDLSPLSPLEKLQDLGLDGNLIQDLSPLAELDSLTNLSLSSNWVEDLSPLADLTQLQQVVVSDNDISDVAPLAGLEHLRSLVLGSAGGGNRVSDVTPLGGLVGLENLDLSNNPVTDLSPLVDLDQLERFHMDRFNSTGPLPDLTPLADLEALTELGLANNSLDDLTFLASCSQLEILRIPRNRIRDLTPLRNLTHLNLLEATGNQISDLSPIADLSRLETLLLGENPISDLTPVSSLTELGWLDLAQNPQIRDFSPLIGLVNLEYLSLRGDLLRDVSWLEQADRLRTLDLGQNQIGDLQPLTSLTGLTALALDQNRVREIEALGGLTQLEQLILADNAVSDIGPLQGLEQLRNLSLERNLVTDLRPLVDNSGLGVGDSLNVRQNLLGEDDCADLGALISRGVRVTHDAPCPACPIPDAPQSQARFPGWELRAKPD